MTKYSFYQTLSIYHCFQGGPNPGVKKAMTTKEINIEDGRDEEPALQHRPDQLKLAHSQSVGIRVEMIPAWDEPEGLEIVPAAAPKHLAIPPFLNLDSDQQQAAVQMTHYLNSLMCMVSEHFTSLER